MHRIMTVETPTLGDRSYLVHDGTVAAVIDPQRDIDRVLELAARERVRITDVFETHVHNDYVSGGLALAAATGATYHVNDADPVTFDREPIKDGAVVTVGDGLRFHALATPGHTYTHLSYVLSVDGKEAAVFTGGSLLYGATGRPDLVGPEHTDTLVREQYRSAQRLAQLPEEAGVFPTHGFGSFCAAGEGGGDSSTIGREKRVNPVLTQREEFWVEELLAGLDAWPAYYAHMGPANLDGAAEPDLSPAAPADPVELRRRLEAGEWVVDLRSRTAFAAGHLPGSLSFGLDGNAATYLGWLIPWGTPVTLLASSAAEIAEAQRELVRIGIDRPAGAATGGPEDWAGGGRLAALERVGFRGLAAALEAGTPLTVLDVRRNLEWLDGHIAGAVHVPLHELFDRHSELPDGPLWVHCGSGYRAALATSWLAGRGHDVVLVDGDFTPEAAAAGLPIVS